MQLAKNVGQLTSISGDLSPNSPQGQQIQQSIAAIQALDNGLVAQLKVIESNTKLAQQNINN